MYAIVGQLAGNEWRDPGPIHSSAKYHLEVHAQTAIKGEVIRLELVTGCTAFEDGPQLIKKIYRTAKDDRYQSEEYSEYDLESAGYYCSQYFP